MKDIIIIILVILLLINMIFIYACMKVSSNDRRDNEGADKFLK